MKNNGINIANVLLISFILKFVLCFFFGSMLDLPRYTYVGNYIIFGWNPYLDHESWPIWFYNKYPALFFELLGAWFSLFGNTVFSLRILILICDFAGTYGMFLIGKHLKNETIGTLFAFLYSFLPFNFLSYMNGENDSIPNMFVIYGIYFFLQEKHLRAAICIALGTCFKIYPLFILLALIIFFFKQNQIKNVCLYLSILAITFFITSLRFLLLSPREYVESLLIHTSRASTGLPFSELLPFLYIAAKFSVDLNFVGLGIIEISISLNFLIQITVIVGLILYTLITQRKETVTKNDALLWALCFLILLPLIMNRGNFTNWAWTSPFLIIILFQNRFDFSDQYQKRILMPLIFYIFVIIALVYHNTAIPYSVFQSYDHMADIEYFIVTIRADELYITPFIVIQMIVFAIWIVIMMKNKRDIILIRILLLNLSDWIIHYLMILYIDQTGWRIVFLIYFFIRIATIISILLFFLLLKSKKLNAAPK